MVEINISSESQGASGPSRDEIEQRLLQLERMGKGTARSNEEEVSLEEKRQQALDAAATALLDITFLPGEDEPLPKETLGGYSGTVNVHDEEEVAGLRRRDQKIIAAAQDQGISFDMIKIAAKEQARQTAEQAKAAREQFMQTYPGGIPEVNQKIRDLPADSHEGQALREQIRSFKWTRRFIENYQDLSD